MPCDTIKTAAILAIALDLALAGADAVEVMAELSATFGVCTTLSMYCARELTIAGVL